ncbi:MAG: hypothetical protein R3C16_09475 [Hyphomonadaceae bacterium]
MSLKRHQSRAIAIADGEIFIAWMEGDAGDERLALARLQRRLALRAELAGEGPNDGGVGAPEVSQRPRLSGAARLGWITVHAQIGLFRRSQPCSAFSCIAVIK